MLAVSVPGPTRKQRTLNPVFAEIYGVYSIRMYRTSLERR